MIHLPPTPYISEKYDSLFKHLITAEWCVESDGHVESPTGYFSITEIPSHEGELNEMREAVFGDEPNEFVWLNNENWPESGWYLTRENDQGLIFVWKMASKHEAVKFYRSWQVEYSKWEQED